MSRGLEGTSPDWQSIDGDLNIFALANGLDLVKNESGRPGRTLEWFRDGLDRRIRILADSGSSSLYTVSVEASKKSGGMLHIARQTVMEAVEFHEIRQDMRALLARLMDGANELADQDLVPEALSDEM